MSSEQLLITLWRRKWIIVLTVIAATAATYLLSRELPNVYTARATLFVGDSGDANSDFEAIQSAQVLAKTYSELIQSKNVASIVAAVLPGDLDAEEILARTTFRPIRETQLIVITAEGASPVEAAEIVDTYASVFADYAANQLESQTSGRITIADTAQTSDVPIRPRPALYSGIMFVLSFFLGAGLALLRDRLDTRLGSDEELSAELGVPVLARVPVVSRRRLRREREHGFVEQRFLEAFRVLRTNLAFLSQEPISKIVVCSGSPGEGKSTSAMGLAQALGEQGRRVVVVEGDLRRPTLSVTFGLDRLAPKGVTHYLALGAKFEEVVHETTVPNVYLVPAGAIPPNPSTLLQEEAVERLIQQASQMADFVVIDSPPLSAGADASILAHIAGTVLFVVNHKRTTRAKTVETVRRLRQTDAAIAGLIVNEVPAADTYDGYYRDRSPDDRAVAGTLKASRVRVRPRRPRRYRRPREPRRTGEAPTH